MNLIDVAGLTSAPVALEPYCRALGISGAVIEPDKRLGWLRAMHEAEEVHTVYTGIQAANFWFLAGPRVSVRVVPGDDELPIKLRVDDPALYYLLMEGLSRSQAKAVLSRKTGSAARDAANAFAERFLSIPLPTATNFIGDSPPPGASREEAFKWEVVDGPGPLTRLARLLEEHNREGKTVGLDTEATSEDDRVAQLVGVGLSFGSQANFYLPVTGPLGDVLQALLMKWFVDSTTKFIAHNAKYDMKVLARFLADE
jgi:hypothetical protein